MSQRLLFLLTLLILTAVGAQAAGVVHLAPDFSFPGPGNKSRSLRSVRGQPVILIVTDSPANKLFRKQLSVLRRGYSRFASRQALLMVALRQGEGPISSNIPFVVVNNGTAVAAAYGVNEKFAVIIIGKDQNLDYQTAKPVAPERMMDVIQNAAPVQLEGRQEIQR